MTKSKSNEIRFTVNAAAVTCGMDDKTLKKKLQRSGITHRAGQKITLYQFYQAVIGDRHAEQVRLTRANAIAAERENAVAEGKLIPMDIIFEVVTRCNLAIRNQIDAMPAMMAPRCNPTDPTHALLQLNEWRNSLYRQLTDMWDVISQDIKNETTRS